MDRWMHMGGLPLHKSIIEHKHHPHTSSYIILIKNIIINSIITYLEFDALIVFKMLSMSRLPTQQIPN
jgi:hypothetical protein